MSRVRSSAGEVEPEDVLEFWLGERGAAAPAADDVARWFARDDALDRSIRDRFGGAVEEAIAGGLGDWEARSPDWVALVVLLDQFARNVHRDAPRAFEGDPRTLSILRGKGEADLAALHPLELYFALVPWMHSEALADQRAGETAFGAWAARVPTGFRGLFEGGAEYARRHRVVIERFGRFPHRNRVLGRVPTDAERAFLAENPDGF